MYDTVGAWLDYRPDFDLTKLEQVLSGYSEKYGAKGEQAIMAGRLKNIYVRAGERGVSFNGSLAVFRHGNNIDALTRKDTQLAVEELADTLHLPIGESQVRRVDVACNFIMQRPVNEYLDRMIGARFFKRTSIKDCQTLNFENSQRALCTYDKVLEFKKKHKGEALPELFHGRNVLRFEDKHTKRIGKQFKRQVVRVADLYEPVFYMSALDQYRNGYNLIQKIRKESALKMKNAKDFEKSLAFYGIMNIGGIETAVSILRSGRQRGEIDRQTFYRRLRWVRSVAKMKPSADQADDIIQELDNKVSQAVACYR